MIQFIPFSKHSLHSFNLLSFFIFRVILRKIRIWIIVPAKLSLFLKYGFSRDPSGLFLGPCNIILNMGSHKLSDNAICRRQVLELPDYEQYIYIERSSHEHSLLNLDLFSSFLSSFVSQIFLFILWILITTDRNIIEHIDESNSKFMLLFLIPKI